MVTNTFPAGTAAVWLKAGAGVLRRQPLFFPLAVLAYLSLVVIVTELPLLGPILASVLQPFGTAAFCAWGHEALLGTKPGVSRELAGLLRDRDVRRRMINLGLWFAGMTVVMHFIVMALALPGLRQWAAQGQGASLLAAIPLQALVAAIALYIPAAMCYTFSPMLVAWRGMPAGKALFISFFACWRNRWPLMAMALALCAVLALAGTAAMVLSRMAQDALWILYIMSPASFGVTLLVFALLWPLWWSVFVASQEELR